MFEKIKSLFVKKNKIKISKKAKEKYKEYLDKWNKIGWDCSSINKAAAKDAIKEMYIAEKLEPPTYYLFFQNPLEVLYASLVIDMYDELNDKDINQAWFDYVVNLLKKRDKYGVECVEYDLFNDEYIKTDSKFAKTIRRQKLKKNLSKYFKYMNYGNHDAAYWCKLDWYSNEVDKSIDTFGVLNVAKECGYSIFLDELAIVSERPQFIKTKRNSNGLLVVHSTDGPAVSFRNGFDLDVVDNELVK